MTKSLFLKFWNFTLTTLALAFLVVFSYPAFIAKPSDTEVFWVEFVQLVSWIAFALDLAIRFILDKNKKYFLRKHPIEIIAVLVPMVRPLRLLRLISFGSIVLEKVAIGKSLGITLKVIITTVFLGYISAVQITLVERDNVSANIKNIGDGLWWTFTTITTVGYGDRFPVSTEGRFIAIFLMILGISLLGVISATIAAWFVRMMQTEDL